MSTTVSNAITISNQLCICQVGDAEVQRAAKKLNIPLRYARALKRLHRKFKIHAQPEVSAEAADGREGRKP